MATKAKGKASGEVGGESGLPSRLSLGELRPQQERWGCGRVGALGWACPPGQHRPGCHQVSLAAFEKSYPLFSS